MCFFAFQRKHYLKGHLMLPEHVSLVFCHLCLIVVFIAHAGRKYLCLLFIHGLLNMWEGFMYILIQVLGQSIVLVLVLSFSFCSSMPVYCNIYLSCCILT